MQVLPWHVAYLGVVVCGNVAVALAHAGWPLLLQVAVTCGLPALCFAAVLAARRTR